MDRTVSLANRQRRFDPGLFAKPCGQIQFPHHVKDREQRRFTFTEYNWATPNNREFRCRRGAKRTFELSVGHRKDRCENGAGREMYRSYGAIVRDASAQFKTAGDFLRMVALDATARRKIRGTAENQIEQFVRSEHGWIPKITLTYFVPMI